MRNRDSVVSVEELARDSQMISHEQAREAVLALVDEHFGNKTTGRVTQFCIPAQPDDTDVLLLAYIRQQKAMAKLVVAAGKERRTPNGL